MMTFKRAKSYLVPVLDAQLSRSKVVNSVYGVTKLKQD